MLKRPARRLPTRFRRPLSPQMRQFATKRHARERGHLWERRKRVLRRIGAVVAQGIRASQKWLAVSVLCVLVLLLVMLLFSPIVRVREIRVIRTDGRVDVRRVLQELGPLYGRHLLFLPSHDVIARVRSAVPDVRSVSVSKNYPSQLSVRISLSPLIARLSIDAPMGGSVKVGTGATVEGAPQRFDALTEGGMYVVVPQEALATLPLIHIVDWGVRPAPSTPLLSPDLLERMTRAEQALVREFSQQITNRTVYLRAREFHLATPTFSFWMDMRSPLEDHLSRLRTFLRTVTLGNVKQYVDLRLTGRVVYK